MTADRRAALIERMARAMMAVDSGPEGSALFDIHMTEFGDGYRKSARAALDLALEEAANVADENGAEVYDDDLIEVGRLRAFKEAAAAIRSLKGTP